jgi:hypothetical protein
MPTALNDLLKATSRSFYLIPRCGTLLPVRVRPQIGLVSGRLQNRVLQGHQPCAIIFGVMEQPDFSSSPWCAFAPGKEAWKREGNFFSAEELKQIDNADDLAIYQPLDPVLSAD